MVQFIGVYAFAILRIFLSSHRKLEVRASYVPACAEEQGKKLIEVFVHRRVYDV